MKFDIETLKDVEIPPMASTIQELLRHLQNPNMDGAFLANQMSNDAGILQSIFKMANSAYFSQGKPTSDVVTAISRIGLLWVRQVLVSHALKNSFSFKANRIFDGNIFRRHSSFVAFVSQELAKKSCPDWANDLFMAGIFHDVGLAAVASFAPIEFELLVEECIRGKVSFETAERNLKMAPHREIGSAIVAHWNFPNSVSRLIEAHDLPVDALNAKVEPGLRRPAELLAVADNLAHRFGSGFSSNYQRDNFISPFSLKRLELTSEDIMATVAMCSEFAGSMFA